ncbi:MAG: hypothetical protein SFW09_00075 [Hyphomicrobiaceae bacterium]|nr:hypothetical protein [Hyphomicrobiaceae bacterium]
MIMRMATAAALSLLLAGTALAQSPAPAPSDPPAATTAAPAAGSEAASATAEAEPTTADACIAAAASLGQSTEGKSFSEEKIEKLDQLFSRMETLCDGKQFSEAMAVAKDIKTVIDGD